MRRRDILKTGASLGLLSMLPRLSFAEGIEA